MTVALLALSGIAAETSTLAAIEEEKTCSLKGLYSCKEDIEFREYVGEKTRSSAGGINYRRDDCKNGIVTTTVDECDIPDGAIVLTWTKIK